MAQAAEQPANADSGVDQTVAERLTDQMFGQMGEEPQPGEENAQVEGDETEQGAEAEAAPEQGEEGEAPPALEDVEWNGKQYKLPPELKSALMAQSDYTRGKQETAALRRMLDLERVQMQHRAQFDNVVAPELAALNQLDYQLQAYRSLDWMGMDTDTANKTRIMVEQLKDQREQLAKAIGQKQSVFEQEMGTLMQTAIQRGDEYLKRHIKEWSPATQQQLETYGMAEGYSEVEMKMLTDARMKKTLWKAMQFDKLKSNKATGQNRVTAQPPGVQPRAASSNQTANQIRDLNYRKSMKGAKTSGEKARLIQERLADKLMGPIR